MGERLNSPLAKRWGSPLFLSLVSLFGSFAQRPWQVYNDTRIELITNPQLFLGRIPDMWTATMDLGHIQTSQFVGYLFPIGPFFALGDWLGLPLWFVQRIWFALLLAMAGWGIVRLVEATRGQTARLAGLIAGLIYITSPFVMVSLNRGSVWLVPYAALPWLLVWTKRGVDNPRGWKAPAAIALLLVFTADATITLVIWVVIAMAILALFEIVTGPGLKATLSFTWRAAVLSFFSSLWWLVPDLIQAKYGTDYLTFTEHAGAILGTPSASESLRLLGYWVSYVTGFAPGTEAMPAMRNYLGDPATVVATFFFPLAAVSSLALIRRWRYGAFYALLFAFAVLAMSAGFPADNPVGKAIYDLYYSSGPLQLLRTTYKAAPLGSVAIAVLAGVLVAACWQSLAVRWKSGDGGLVRSRLLPAAAVLFFIAALGLWGRPLWTGNSVNPIGFFKEVPKPWVDAVKFADDTSPPNTRIAILPGDVFSDYAWGNAQMSIAPGLTNRPILVRQILRAATPNAAQLLEGTDNLVQQGRLTPGQLNPLLQLMGVGAVMVGTDEAPGRNPTVDPARAAAAFNQQAGFEKPVAEFGHRRLFSPPVDQVGASVRLPQVRVYAAPVPPHPGIIRVLPRSNATVVDGDAQGVLAMAAVGALDPKRALFYSGALDRHSYEQTAGVGAKLVYTDSNRRQLLIPQDVNTNTSYVLQASEPVDREFPSYDPFPALGASGRTTAVYTGLKSLYAPLSPVPQFNPAQRPFAAFDGDPDTAWWAEPMDSAHRYLEFTLAKPAPLRSIEVLPRANPLLATNAVRVSVNGGPLKDQSLKSGWNKVDLGGGIVRTVRIYPRTSAGYYIGSPAGAIREIRIPGVTVSEALRMPSDLTGLVKGRDLSHSAIEVIAERITADFPGTATTAKESRAWLGGVNQADGERSINRLVNLPAARSFVASGWGRIGPDASDSKIDALTGPAGGNVFTSSSRYQGFPVNRASSAFDRNQATEWASLFDEGALPWIRWQGTSPVSVHSIGVVVPTSKYRQPTAVTVETDGGTFKNLPVDAGKVTLPRTVATSSVKIIITAVSDPAAGTFFGKAVAKRAVAIAEIQIPGLAPAGVRRSGSFSSVCGALSVRSSAGTTPLKVSGQIESVDHGQPLKASPCGAPLALKQGENLVTAASGGLFVLDHLRLLAPAPEPPASGSLDGVVTAGGKVQLAGAGWLVLGNTYSPGWKATCRDKAGNEKDLGPPTEIAGFANGWPITGATCITAKFTFGPQAMATVFYWVSAVVIFALIVLLIVIRRRGRSENNLDRDQGDPQGEADRPLGGFGMPAGIDRLVAILYGIGAVLIVTTVVIYLMTPADGPNPIGFGYASERISGHWTAFLAVVVVSVGGLTQMIQVRRSQSRT